MQIQFTDFDGNTKIGRVLFDGFVSCDMPRVYEVEVDGVFHTTVYVNKLSLEQIKYLNSPWS